VSPEGRVARLDSRVGVAIFSRLCLMRSVSLGDVSVAANFAVVSQN
jgi:hypothetical protein